MTTNSCGFPAGCHSRVKILMPSTPAKLPSVTRWNVVTRKHANCNPPPDVNDIACSATKDSTSRPLEQHGIHAAVGAGAYGEPRGARPPEPRLGSAHRGAADPPAEGVRVRPEPGASARQRDADGGPLRGARRRSGRPRHPH